MGTYGVGSFDTDDAHQWVAQLGKTEGHAFLRESLQNLLDLSQDQEGSLQLPECCRALASAEVVAALRGRPSSYLTQDVTSWVERQRAVNYELVTLAADAADVIRERGQLREIWSAQDGLDEWLEAVDDLRGRLQ